MQQKHKKLLDSSRQTAFIYPGENSFLNGKKIYFLMSLLQVESIVNASAVSISKVPFSSSYIYGISMWNESVLPVISLEKCLKIQKKQKKVSNEKKIYRILVVRAVQSENNQLKIKKCMLKIFGDIKLVSLPIIHSNPVSIEILPNNNLVKGIYEWDQGYLIVVDMGNIIK